MPQKQKSGFRSLHREVRADRRRLALRKLDDGWDKYKIADLAEVHYKTVEDWIKNKNKLKKNGYYGLKRGNPKDRRLLDDKKQKEIISIIKNSTPEKQGVSAYLWSRKAILELVKRKYNITLNPQRVSHYTGIWGFTPQRPKKQATEQDPKKIKQWLKEDYPKIIQRAKKEQAEIHWGDETGLNLNTNYQRTYAQKGKTPAVKIPAKKISYSLISSVTNQGKLRYMAYKGGMNARLFKIFIQRLTRDTDKKIFLIVDNLRVHHAKIIQEWQKEHEKELEIFFPTSLLSSRQSR